MPDPALARSVFEGDSARAELACSVLVGHGVRAWVSGGVEIWEPQPVRVLVAAEDVAAAEDVLREHGLGDERE